MARGRMLNQKIAEDIDFNAMSIEAQFMFMRTIPFLDRDGLIVGHPSLLWSKVAPLLPQYAAAMTAIINEWIEAGFVISYTADKTPLLYFKAFSKNQAGMRYEREQASIYPPPPGFYRNGNGIEPVADKPNPPSQPTDNSNPQDSGKTPAEVRQVADTLPPERKENRKEQELPCAHEAPVEPQNSGSSGDASLPEPEKPLNRQTDADYAKVCVAIESNGFGSMTQILSEEVGELLKEYPCQWVLDAMRVSVQANKRSMRYVSGILRKWMADGRDPAQPVMATGQSPPPPKPEPFTMPAAARALRDRLQNLSPQ